MKRLDEKVLETEYRRLGEHYAQVGEVIKSILGDSLNREGVDYDFIQMRVKSFSSFFEKALRYDLTDPLNEIEDICGVRVVHLFDNDLDRIKKVIKARVRELKHVDKTLQSRDPSKKKEREFSYRSYHIFATLRDEELMHRPELKDLAVEIQVRTICMHAWASIEHKLNYKKQQDLPKEFRPVITRKFSQMSAMLEVADELFVSLRNEKFRVLENYRAALSDEKTKGKVLDQDLNIDVLQAYLEKRFPSFRQESGRLKYLLEEMRQAKVNLRDVDRGEQVLKEQQLFTTLLKNYPTESKIPTQTGMARLILDITKDRFYENRKVKLSNSRWMKFVDLSRDSLRRIANGLG